mmetsp:Transcript_69832/g.214154  ORF Transcript_69832/g.214154 Transcript_69832/m.214154 type:complete len:315 (+) Transcript_69832:420-1364(+)
MCFVYSSRVVAPTTCSSPRARAGFSRLAASIAESGPAMPAPTSWWISSMNRVTSRLPLVISSITDFSLSSNSPRYFVPATRRPMSRENRSFPFRRGGTSPLAMSWAKPSATAVLPTPGGPTRHALFFLLRRRICMTRWISSWRPTTGSSFPSRAISVRFVAMSSRVVFLSPPSAPTSTSSLPLSANLRAFSATIACCSLSPSTRNCSDKILAAPLPDKAGWPRAASSSSVPMSAAPARALAVSKSSLALSLKGREPELPPAAGPRVAARFPTAFLSAVLVTPTWTSAAEATVLSAPFALSPWIPRSTNSEQTTP